MNTVAERQRLPPHYWLALQLLWPMAGLLIVYTRVGFLASTGRFLRRDDILFMIVPWLLWLLVGPAVVALAVRVPFVPSRRTISIHLAGLAAVLSLHYLADLAIRSWMGGSIYYPHSSLRAGIAARLLLDVVNNVLMYVATISAVAAWAYASNAERRISAVEEAKRRLEAQAAAADAMKLRPRWFQSALLAAEEAVEEHPEEAEERLESLSDEVRRRLAGVAAGDAAPAIDPEPAVARAGSSLFHISLYVAVLAVIAAWRTVVANVFQMPLSSVGRPLLTLMIECAGWLYAALYAPIVAWAARAVQHRRLVLPLQLGLLIAACVLVALTAWATFLALLWLSGLVSRDNMALFEFVAARMYGSTWLAQYLIVALGTASCAYLVEAARRVELAERERMQLRSQAAQHELRVLRTQLDPHFLCNALNSILSLIDDDPARARLMIRELRHFYEQCVAEEGRPEVTLREELALVKAYTNVEAIRFAERMRVEIEADDGALPLPVPTLVLQPLVENAIRHGVARLSRPSTIRLVASVAMNRLVIEVVNELPSRGRGGDPASGIGLRNTMARLRHLYGAGAQLTAGEEAHVFRARLSIPCGGVA